MQDCKKKQTNKKPLNATVQVVALALLQPLLSAFLELLNVCQRCHVPRDSTPSPHQPLCPPPWCVRRGQRSRKVANIHQTRFQIVPLVCVAAVDH